MEFIKINITNLLELDKRINYMKKRLILSKDKLYVFQLIENTLKYKISRKMQIRKQLRKSLQKSF